MDDLSVIVPVYNLEHFLTPLLETLKSQDVGEYRVEYIFVLNNCTDDSRSVIEKSGLECKILNCDIQGCGCARNVGFEASNGEYVWFIDGDDYLLSNDAIRDVIDLIKIEDANIIRVLFKSEKFGMNYFSMVWQYVMRRDFIEEFRFRKAMPAEDDEFMLKVLNKAGYDTVSYILMPRTLEPLYYYNFLREGSNMYRFMRGEDIN